MTTLAIEYENKSENWTEFYILSFPIKFNDFPYYENQNSPLSNKKYLYSFWFSIIRILLLIKEKFKDASSQIYFDMREKNLMSGFSKISQGI